MEEWTWGGEMYEMKRQSEEMWGEIGRWQGKKKEKNRLQGLEIENFKEGISEK